MGEKGRVGGLGVLDEVFPAVGVIFFEDDGGDLFGDVAIHAAEAVAFDKGDHVVFGLGEVVREHREPFSQMPGNRVRECVLKAWAGGAAKGVEGHSGCFTVRFESYIFASSPAVPMLAACTHTLRWRCAFLACGAMRRGLAHRERISILKFSGVSMFGRYLLCASICWAGGGAVSAQVNADLEGRVVDANGAAVGGAQVRVTADGHRDRAGYGGFARGGSTRLRICWRGCTGWR